MTDPLVGADCGPHGCGSHRACRLVWHLDGGFEGLLALGWNRATIYRKISAFRKVTGQHPDEFKMPGVTLSIEQYQEAGSVAWKMRGPEPADVRAAMEARERG